MSAFFAALAACAYMGFVFVVFGFVPGWVAKRRYAKRPQEGMPRRFVHAPAPAVTHTVQ